jgi:hypothetical protein
MGILRKYKNLILLVTVPVLLLYMTNSLLNRHSHLVRGYTYSHAHPFNKDTGKTGHPFHTHTDAELQLLNLISDMDILVLFILLVLSCTFLLSKLQVRDCNSFHPGPVLLSSCPRGPPLFA